uniref:histidine kinase n=1 Tax=Brassica oleracea TaxID=3712 RepID=A0A3P6BXL0_BRAOL|nr:unnamed protein product [Brassica oleracea]
MQLKEEEFNLAKLVEDVIDFFHPVAMKKGVDVVLDMHDGSVFKCSNVRGDGGKLKQILNNLVSNAVKFTVQGHISIRAWAQRTSSNAVLASDNEGGLSKFSKKSKDQGSMSNSVRNNGKMMEFVFEVDDTGKGIPMEMRKSVFENYVQVRETDQGQQGTGLGLGIVQSLVRLMGGEIRIIDKAMGEKGTCFEFNVLLSAASESQVSRQDTEEGDHMHGAIKTSSGGSMSIRSMSPRLHNWLSSSPKQERSRVLLLMKDGERRRVTEKYIKSLGIKVTVVKKWEHLNHVLERLIGVSRQGSMGRNESLSSSSRELPLIGMDGIDSRSQTPKRTRHGFSPALLVVIDAETRSFPELYDIVEQFRRGLHHGVSCKVVWLNDRGDGSLRGDISCSKPFHGSCLNKVLKMLPEFGGTEPKEDKQGALKPSEDELLSGKRVMVVDDNHTTSLYATIKLKKMGASEIKQCYNGKEAVRLVSEWLTQREHEEGGSSEMLLPFDYIFMDCQMPEMDGYEATREIRKMEEKYGAGLHIPIIAVSGHDHGSTEAIKTIEAGMDAFLEKNLNHDQLAKVIREITSKRGAMDAKPSSDSII